MITINRHGAEAARRAHNPEDVGSKPTAGIIQFAVLKKKLPRCHYSNPLLNRHGAEAARRAHNPEVTRSKRVAGIYLHIAMVHQGTGATLNRCGAEVSARGS